MNIQKSLTVGVVNGITGGFDTFNNTMEWWVDKIGLVPAIATGMATGVVKGVFWGIGIGCTHFVINCYHSPENQESFPN